MACHKTSLTANKMGERTRVWEFMRTENDAELIEAYAKRDDQCAFAEIVSRHGAMVFHVCFRKLTNRHDAEDASQAVFMALIKNSEKMHWKDSLAGCTTWTEGQGKDGALQQVASEWAGKDPVAASEWVMKLPEGKYKDELLNGVVAQWATREPENAKDWIEKSSLPQDEKDKLMKKIPKK